MGIGELTLLNIACSSGERVWCHGRFLHICTYQELQARTEVEVYRPPEWLYWSHVHSKKGGTNFHGQFRWGEPFIICYPVYGRSKRKSASSDPSDYASNKFFSVLHLTNWSIFSFPGQYGDYDPNFHEPGFLAHDELLPKRVSLYSI